MTSYHGTSEIRRVRKPLMEKKRRARINDSLDTLKQILLDNRSKLLRNSEQWRQFSEQQHEQLKTTKLEKADILEMTVNYLRAIHQKKDSNSGHANNRVTSTSGMTWTNRGNEKEEPQNISEYSSSIHLKENICPPHSSEMYSPKRSVRSAFKLIQSQSSKVNGVQKQPPRHWRPWWTEFFLWCVLLYFLVNQYLNYTLSINYYMIRSVFIKTI